MNCGTIGDSANCQASYNIQAQLAASKQGEWQDIAISLNCFAEKGLQLSKIAVPFELRTSGAVNLSVNHIRLVPSKANSAPLNCPQ
jgi:beta-glucosidase